MPSTTSFIYNIYNTISGQIYTETVLFTSGFTITKQDIVYNNGIVYIIQSSSTQSTVISLYLSLSPPFFQPITNTILTTPNGDAVCCPVIANNMIYLFPTTSSKKPYIIY